MQPIGATGVDLHEADPVDALRKLEHDGETVEFPIEAQVGAPAAVRYGEPGGIRNFVFYRC